MKRPFTQHLKLTGLRLFWDMDTTTVRLILGISSYLWGISGLIAPRTFNLKALTLMSAMAPWWTWCTLFIIHGVLVTWRFIDPKPRPRAALLVNTYGFLVWTTTTFMGSLSLSALEPSYAVNPLMAVEMVLCVFAGWALYRTGMTTEIVTP
jgi:hypothetical protein